MLREKVQASQLCKLRTGCEVILLRENDAGVELEYKNLDGSKVKLQTRWLIGADGKRGAVRKTFLERVADIRQLNSDYRYEGTWVATNLKIRLPTPETHPDFPPFKAGLKPEEAYDLFWPKGWHFCSPPGKPTASGRFGPYDQRLWRHEFRQDDWKDSMNAIELFWEHLTPMITRTQDEKGMKFGQAAVWPRDCIEILRCRPFTFTHKVVNRWYHRKSVLIGDAAHVFPPFGGQGIASGIRDAHQLAWRIALIEDSDASDALTESILKGWATERIQSVKDAALITRINGILCNNARPWLFALIALFELLMSYILWTTEPYDPQAGAEQKGFNGLPGGFFLSRYGGGRRLPQVYVDTVFKGKVLSDDMLVSATSVLQILIIVQDNAVPKTAQENIRALLQKTGIPPGVIAPDATYTLSLTPCAPESIGSFAERSTRKASLTPLRRLSKKEAKPGYDLTAFESRLGKGTQFAIVRPDFYIFATARNVGELEVCLQGLKKLL